MQKKFNADQMTTWSAREKELQMKKKTLKAKMSEAKVQTSRTIYTLG